MLVKCAVCGTHVPSEVALEVPVGSETHQFCSARCADAERAAKAAPLTKLPRVPRRILVAVDGSGPSVRAVEMAAALAAMTRGEIRLLHAVDFGWLQALGLASPTGPIGLGVSLEEIERRLHADAEAQLDRGRRICEEAAVRVSTCVELRRPLEAILEAAREADLVVMGSRGRGALSGAMLGSLSQRVIGATRTPVLVVH